MPPYLMEAPLNIVLLSLWLVVMLLDVPIHGVPGLEAVHCTLQNFWNAIHTPIQYNFWSAIRGSLQQYFWSAIHTPLHIPIQNFVLEKTLCQKQKYDDKIRDPNHNEYGTEFMFRRLGSSTDCDECSCSVQKECNKLECYSALRNF